MIRFSAGRITMLNTSKVQLPASSVIVFDKGYRDYSTYNRTIKHITWITRHRDSSVYKIRKEGL